MPHSTSYSKVETLHFQLNKRNGAGDYDIDYVAVEYYPAEDRFDFRLELGSGLGIYWALPESTNGLMWLAHVDGAAYHVDEPEEVARPWSADVDLTFDDVEGKLGDIAVRFVRIHMTSSPMSYRFELRTQRGDEPERITRLSWSAASP